LASTGRRPIGPRYHRAVKIEQVPFQTTDWSKIAATEHPGEVGVARWRTVETGNVRVRMVEYSPGYVADHWCERGHVILVLAGELETELRDGRRFVLGAGASYQVAHGESAHRSVSPKGATLFIVD
jgi:quercetin dioxygenase-like cupin family protein